MTAFLIAVGLRMVLSDNGDRPGQDACDLVVRGRLAVAIVALSASVGVLAGLIGIGGGIIIVPFLIFMCHQPVKGTAGTTALIVIFSSLFGAIGHSAVGNIDIVLIVPTALVALVGAQLGARHMMRSRPGSIMVGFGLVMWLLAGILVLKLLDIM
jgi:uncharacterized membrane protein YfcA